jgi:hypothetical protein
MHVTQLAQAGAWVHPGVKLLGAPAVPETLEKGSSLDPPPAEHPASATPTAGAKYRWSAIRASIEL